MCVCKRAFRVDNTTGEWDTAADLNTCENIFSFNYYVVVFAFVCVCILKRETFAMHVVTVLLFFLTSFILFCLLFHLYHCCCKPSSGKKFSCSSSFTFFRVSFFFFVPVFFFLWKCSHILCNRTRKCERERHIHRHTQEEHSCRNGKFICIV